MTHHFTTASVFVLRVIALIFWPLLIAWSWVSFARGVSILRKNSWPCVMALFFATCSSLLFWGVTIYSHVTQGFAFHDPHLLQIFRIGLILSSIALISGMIGIAFRNPLRWRAPVASLGMLIFWLLAAIAE